MNKELQPSSIPEDNEIIEDVYYCIDFWNPPSRQFEISQWKSTDEHSNPERIGRFIRPDQIGYSHHELRPAGSPYRALDYYITSLAVKADNAEAFGNPDALQTINDARTVVRYWNYWRRAEKRADSKDADQQTTYLTPIENRSFSEHASLIQEGIDVEGKRRRRNQDTARIERSMIRYIETIIDRCPAIYEQPYHVEIFDNLREALENKRPLQPYDPENDEAPFDPASFYFSYDPIDTANKSL